MWIAAALMTAVSVAGAVQAQEGTTDAEMRQAREQLEAAAREVARLAADYSGPVIDFVQDLGPMGRRAVLGIGIEDAEDGVRVVGVTPGGGAGDAGIETGDLIVAIDGAELAGQEGRSPSRLLVAQMGNVDPGDTVTLTIRRDGSDSDIEVETQPSASRGHAFSLPGDGPRGGPQFFFNRPLGRWADMELVELTPALGAYFGTEEGVLVVRAPRDESLQLQDGDVIVEISGRTPMDTGHAMRILASFEPGEQLQLRIMREQREQTLDIEIPGGETGN
jgi:S1-C subfamily serine protease